MENLTPEDFDFVVRVNLTGQYNLFHAAFAPMRAQQDGLISCGIVIGSCPNVKGRASR